MELILVLIGWALGWGSAALYYGYWPSGDKIHKRRAGRG